MDVLRTLSPVLRGEGRVRGLWHVRLARDSSEDHGRDARATGPVRPLTPALSPEYRGEGAGACLIRCGISQLQHPARNAALPQGLKVPADLLAPESAHDVISA